MKEIQCFLLMYVFLVGAFLKKKVDYSHFFSSVFSVGAFSLKEKSPTLTVSSFFVFFSVDNLTLSGPLFLQSLFTFVQLIF